MLHQLCRKRLKVRAVFIRPPGVQVALAIELRALVIKAMADFVPDDRTNGAEVLSGIRIRVIERRAQDGGREGDVIDHRVIEGIDGLRGGDPLIAVGGLANLCQLIVVGKGGPGAGIGNQIRALVRNLQPGVIAPGIGKTNLGLELGELF